MLGGRNPEPEYVAARGVLLDALEALASHRKSIVLVGSQAVYLQTGDSGLAVAPYTTDGDLAIDPRGLEDEPALAAALGTAGFVLSRSPGTWSRNSVEIDLLVPAALGGPGRRGARLGVHGSEVARKAVGLEAAIVDHTRHRIAALDSKDSRSFEIEVAGIGALLVAKLHKIAERSASADRRRDKDALDVLRLLRAANTGYLGGVLAKLTEHSDAGAVTWPARGFLAELFGDRDAVGPQMAARASIGLEEEIPLRISCEVLTKRLLDAWKFPAHYSS